MFCGGCIPLTEHKRFLSYTAYIGKIYVDDLRKNEIRVGLKYYLCFRIIIIINIVSSPTDMALKGLF